MKRLLPHMELWLSAAGVAVILLLPRLMGVTSDNHWQVTAITAIVVGMLHGFIFWTVRQRQRRVREQTLQQARAMLRDGIQKQVAALLTMDATASEEQRKRLDGVFDSLILLDHQLDSLSSEGLRAWTDSKEGRVELARPGGAPGKRPAPGLHVHNDSRN